MFARFDENQAMTFQDIKETKRYGLTDRRTDAHTDAHTDNVKTVYPTTNKVCGGYNKGFFSMVEGKYSTCTSLHRNSLMVLLSTFLPSACLE